VSAVAVFAAPATNALAPTLQEVTQDACTAPAANAMAATSQTTPQNVLDAHATAS
jgi:hypothetical protein